MDRQVDLSAVNAQWSEDDERWSMEIEHWTQLTHQWAALLYLIDRNLPEQTTEIERHKSDIEEHMQNLIRFRCGLDEHCIPTCPDHVTADQLEKKYKELADVHHSMSQMHDRIKREFTKKKLELRELAQRLLDLLDD